MRMIRRIIRIAGFAIFALAFFLPAVAPPATESGPGSGPVRGWVCAGFSLIPSGALIRHPVDATASKHWDEYALLLSGWVNPLVLIYLLFCIRPGWIWRRRAVGAAILICLGGAWAFLAHEHLTLLVGHYLWVAGILMLLMPELMPVPHQSAADGTSGN